MKTKTWTDPIVEEVRAWREEMLREAGYDLKRLGEQLMKSQKRHGGKLVKRKPKKPGE